MLSVKRGLCMSRPNAAEPILGVIANSGDKLPVAAAAPMDNGNVGSEGAA